MTWPWTQIDSSIARRSAAPDQPGAGGAGAPTFRHGVSSATFGYPAHFSWGRVIDWIGKRHPGIKKNALYRRFYPSRKPTDDNVTLVSPDTVAITRYRYRGNTIATPGRAGETHQRKC